MPTIALLFLAVDDDEAGLFFFYFVFFDPRFNEFTRSFQENSGPCPRLSPDFKNRESLDFNCSNSVRGTAG